MELSCFENKITVNNDFRLKFPRTYFRGKGSKINFTEKNLWQLGQNNIKSEKIKDSGQISDFLVFFESLVEITVENLRFRSLIETDLLKETRNSHFCVTPQKSSINVCLMKLLRSTVTKK